MRCKPAVSGARRIAWIGVMLASFAWASGLHAQDARRPQDARAAYDLGVEAHGRGAYAEAARKFAEADTLAPNDTALQAAIEAAVLADEPVLAMTLVDRATSRPPHEGVQRAVQDAKVKFADKTGQLTIRCTGATRCDVTVDGSPIEAGSSVWVLSGTRAVAITFGEKKVERTVFVEPRAKLIVDVDPPAEPPPKADSPPPPPPEPVVARPAPKQTESSSESAFASPWFWLGAGLTATFAAASVWSASDVSGKHDDFVADGCDQIGRAGCGAAAADGKDAQLRTNLLLGATALLGAATVVVVLVPSGSSEPDTTTSRGFAPVITARGSF